MPSRAFHPGLAPTSFLPRQAHGSFVSPWLAALPHRLAAHAVFKTIMMTMLMTAFFIAYFQVLKFPVFAVTIMPLTVVDRAIAFHPAALVPYLSLWIYITLAPGLLETKSALIRYCWQMVVLGSTGLLIFFFWPTIIPHQEIDVPHFAWLAFLKTVDAAGNACPSLHAAFAVFTAIWLERILLRQQAPVWIRLASACWGFGIVYSTLATKQHVSLDVVAGAALGVIGAGGRNWLWSVGTDA